MAPNSEFCPCVVLPNNGGCVVDALGCVLPNMPPVVAGALEPKRPPPPGVVVFVFPNMPPVVPIPVFEVLLPKRPPPILLGAVALFPKSPPDGAAWVVPNGLVPVFPVALLPNSPPVLVPVDTGHDLINNEVERRAEGTKDESGVSLSF